MNSSTEIFHRLYYLPLCQRPCQLKRVPVLYLLQVKVTHCLKADEAQGYNYDVLKATWWKSGWAQEYAHTSCSVSGHKPWATRLGLKYWAEGWAAVQSLAQIQVDCAALVFRSSDIWLELKTMMMWANSLSENQFLNSHRVIEGFGLEGILKIIEFQSLWHGQRHLLLDQASLSPT